MKLHDYLTSRNIGVADFAGLAGLSAVTIYKYLAGERTPRKKALDRLTSATNGAVTANDFFYDDPPGRNGKHKRSTEGS